VRWLEELLLVSGGDVFEGEVFFIDILILIYLSTATGQTPGGSGLYTYTLKSYIEKYKIIHRII
jgi:hypothetical protein